MDLTISLSQFSFNLSIWVCFATLAVILILGWQWKHDRS